MGPFITIAIRLAVPTLILKWPLAGMIAAAVADITDVIILALLESGTFEDYTIADKLLDTYTLMFALIVALRWDNSIVKRTCVVLFLYRVVGIIVLVITNERWVLFAFPSVFDFFFVYHLVTVRWFPVLVIDSYRDLIIVLSILLTMKLFQEYILHVAQTKPLCWVNTKMIEPVLVFTDQVESEPIVQSWCASLRTMPVISLYMDINETIQTHIRSFFRVADEPSSVPEWLNALENTFITRPYERSCR